MKIYTRKGDDGTTSLWYGGRVEKNDARTEAYGSLDESNSALGIARSLASYHPRLAADVLHLQNDLFVAGAELATAPEARERLEAGVSRLDENMVGWLEQAIDHYMDQVDLPPKFVIPGGTQLSAQLDLARAVLRRAERRIVALDRAQPLDGLGRAAVREPRVGPALRDGAVRGRAGPGAVRGARQVLRGSQVKVSARRRKGYAHSLTAGNHTLIADEPPSVGGTDTGARPTQLLALSLAACTAVTIEMYADRKQWDVGDVAVDVEYEIDPGGTSRFDVVIQVARRDHRRAAGDS